jgi:hypothetical protein
VNQGDPVIIQSSGSVIGVALLGILVASIGGVPGFWVAVLGEATIAFAVGFCAVARSALGESPTALDDRYCLTDNAAKASVCGLFGNRHVIRAGGLSEVFPSRPVKEIAYMPSAYLSRDGSGGLRPGHWAAGLAAGIVRE